jgi:alkylation response protein AidB-like acyl-CoA dehydrogenase
MALEMTLLRVATSRGESPGPEASILKIKGIEILQAITELMLEAVGPYAQTFDQAAMMTPGAGDAAAAIERAVDVATALACVQAVGMMETLNAHTVEHLKTRQQFGQAIGRFQVLQHRAADMFIDCEQSRSIAWLALAQALGTGAAARRRAVSAAKAHVGRSARAVAQAGVQLHGGLGVTEELPAAHYAKALTLFDFALGDTAHHLERFAAGR